MDPGQCILQMRQALLSKDDPQEARKLAGEFLSGAPDAEVMSVAARYFLVMGNVSQARSVIRDLLQVNPTAETYYLASLVAVTETQRQSFLKDAIRLDPFHPHAVPELDAVNSSSLSDGKSQAHSHAMPISVPSVERSRLYLLLRRLFVLGFALDFAAVFVPSQKMSFGFFGDTRWDTYMSVLRFYQRNGESDTWIFMAAVMAMAGFALLGARLPSRAVFVLGGIFSILHIFLRWFYGADSRVTYHPFYVAFICIAVPMQIIGLFITPTLNKSASEGQRNG